MKDQFVTYAIAEKLKELGFNEPCIACWRPAPKWMTKKEPRLYGYFVNEFKEFFNNKLKSEITAAPLWQQVFDWFREKHTIDVVYIPAIGWQVYTYTKNLDEHTFYEIDLPEPAYQNSRQAAILKALELITN